MSVKSSRGQNINGGAFRNLTSANEYGGGFKASGGDVITEVDGYMVHTYNASGTSSDCVGNTDGATTYYQHETGTDQVTNTATTTIAANIESGDFDITRGEGGGADLRGDGEFIMKIRRFVPDFLSQTGNTQVTLELRDYSNSSQASSPLGPFTITSSTTKVDTRARARSVALKVANTGSAQDWKLGSFRLDIQPDGRR